MFPRATATLRKTTSCLREQAMDVLDSTASDTPFITFDSLFVRAGTLVAEWSDRWVRLVAGEGLARSCGGGCGYFEIKGPGCRDSTSGKAYGAPIGTDCCCSDEQARTENNQNPNPAVTVSDVELEPFLASFVSSLYTPAITHPPFIFPGRCPGGRLHTTLPAIDSRKRTAGTARTSHTLHCKRSKQHGFPHPLAPCSRTYSR